jgi:hypothetical protein
MVFRIGVVTDIRHVQVPAEGVRFHLVDYRTGQDDGAFALESVFELRHEPNSLLFFAYWTKIRKSRMVAKPDGASGPGKLSGRQQYRCDTKDNEKNAM